MWHHETMRIVKEITMTMTTTIITTIITKFNYRGGVRVKLVCVC